LSVILFFYVVIIVLLLSLLLMNFICYSESVKFYSRHALKGQKPLAQGIALGIYRASLSPCKGKSFIIS